MGRRADRKTLALATGIAVSLLLLPAASAALGVTTRITLASGGGQTNGPSQLPAMSADGRFVAFYSDASNLVAGDTNRVRDVFVRDRSTGATRRVSVASDGTQATGHSFAPAISADGRYVAFYSYASNLVAGDANGSDDVFVHDLQSGTTTRVSVASSGAEANSGSYSPALSGDGRLVAFLSDATNLTPADANNARDVFVRDRQSGVTRLVSVASDGTQANLDSFSPELSADGRFVAFTSYATNLVADDTNEGSDVFLGDLQNGTTARVNLYAGGVEAEGDSFRPSISADGRFIAFDSDAWNLVWGDTNETSDIFVYDRQSGTSTRVSVDDGGTQANGTSLRPSLTPDGRFVAFDSEAPNLVAGDTNGASDVFVRDRQSGATTRVSVGNGGVEANGDSIRPALSSDGSLVAFESDATNVVAGDTNGFTDLFLHDTTAEPPPPPPPPAVRCRVPKVIGLRLATARTRIHRARCQVGGVRRARSRRVRVGRVLAQSPRAGVTRARGAKVYLVVGRR